MALKFIPQDIIQRKISFWTSSTWGIYRGLPCTLDDFQFFHSHLESLKLSLFKEPSKSGQNMSSLRRKERNKSEGSQQMWEIQHSPLQCLTLHACLLLMLPQGITCLGLEKAWLSSLLPFSPSLKLYLVISARTIAIPPPHFP